MNNNVIFTVIDRNKAPYSVEPFDGEPYLLQASASIGVLPILGRWDKDKNRFVDRFGTVIPRDLDMYMSINKEKHLRAAAHLLAEAEEARHVMADRLSGIEALMPKVSGVGIPFAFIPSKGYVCATPDGNIMFNCGAKELAALVELKFRQDMGVNVTYKEIYSVFETPKPEKGNAS